MACASHLADCATPGPEERGKIVNDNNTPLTTMIKLILKFKEKSYFHFLSLLHLYHSCFAKTGKHKLKTTPVCK